MTKYIIEIEDEPNIATFDKSKYYKCKQVPYWYVSENIKNKLTPYTEPNREQIENEVWDLAINIDTRAPDWEWQDMTYQEAKEEYEEWIVKRDEMSQIRVGDEVVYHGNKYVVGYVGADKVYHIVDRNWIRVVVQGDYQIFKTERYFPEVAELLKKMKEE